jgi:probable phosphoglycerate mutase
MKNIITIQHTQSIHHTNGMLGAWTDWELTELGKIQANNIGKSLQKKIEGNKYILYSSDLKRAKQTADLIGLHLNIKPIYRKELREVNAGIETPTPVQWFNENKIEKDENTYDPDYKPFQNAESDRDLWYRLYPFMKEILSNEEENIIIVSHGTALKFFISMWEDDDFAAIEKCSLWGKSGGVSKLCMDNQGNRTIEVLNDVSYIKTVVDTVIIEQTNDYPKRMKYNPENNSFFVTEYDSLSYVRNCPHPYGWLKESGTPPESHLDAILLSSAHYELGDELPVKIVGVFLRNDGDNKLVSIPTERPENDFLELPQVEKDDLHRLYPYEDIGEGWFGVETANKVIADFYANGKQRK